MLIEAILDEWEWVAVLNHYHIQLAVVDIKSLSSSLFGGKRDKGSPLKQTSDHTSFDYLVDLFIDHSPLGQGCPVGYLPEGSVNIDGEGHKVVRTEVGEVIVKYVYIPLHHLVYTEVIAARVHWSCMGE